MNKINISADIRAIIILSSYRFNDSAYTIDNIYSETESTQSSMDSILQPSRFFPFRLNLYKTHGTAGEKTEAVRET